jgi:hypothetical protein
MENWTGQFNSSRYPSYSKGIIKTQLVDMSKSFESFDTNFKIKYTGLYRQGDNIASTVKLSNDLKEFSFSLANGQKIVFSATDIGPTSISGTYLSQAPHDKGNFIIIKGDNIPHLDGKSEKCCIL